MSFGHTPDGRAWDALTFMASAGSCCWGSSLLTRPGEVKHILVRVDNPPEGSRVSTFLVPYDTNAAAAAVDDLKRVMGRAGLHGGMKFEDR